MIPHDLPLRIIRRSQAVRTREKDRKLDAKRAHVARALMAFVDGESAKRAANAERAANASRAGQ